MSQKNLNIAVVAANGRVGTLVVKEAVERGFGGVDLIESGEHVRERVSVVSK